MLVRPQERYQLDNNIPFSVLHHDNYKTIFEECDDKSKTLTLTADEFNQHIADGRMEPILREPTPRLFTDKQKSVRDKRVLYMEVLGELVSKHGLQPTTRESYERLIKEVERKHPELTRSNHPGKSTICRHWKAWVNHGYDKTQDYCLGEHNNVAACYKAYCDEINKHEKDLVMVSESTYRRRLKKFSAINDKLADPNLSQKERNQLMNKLTHAIKVEYAFQRVELDRLELNLCLIDDKTGEPTERVSIYLAIDCYSRCIIGCVVEIGQGENKESVVNLIQSIFTSDSNGCVGGKPYEIVMDNGPGFNNGLMNSLCTNLKTGFRYNPSNMPMRKPFVESINNTIKMCFLKGYKVPLADGSYVVGISGYLPKRTQQPENSSKNLKQVARVKKSDFYKHLNDYIIHYHNSVHSQTGEKPIERLQNSMIMSPSAAINFDKVQSQFHVFTSAKEYKLQSDGSINIFKHKYVGLKWLSNELGTYGLKDATPSVTVMYNPFDGRKVTVVAVHPKTGATLQEVAEIYSDEFKSPISVEELLGHEPKSVDLFALQLTTDDTVLAKRTIRKNRSGKPVRTYEDNNDKQLSTAERIAESHENQRNNKTYPARIAGVDNEPDKKDIAFDPNNTWDSENLWEDD
ncbi:hypothetical protein [uncultured Shewanella sp.]|uniref:hypothetical protein n=1 Tax=uncultured Shewanella sp. TaxID=173975 RepID=UPI0026025C59|nr:hypothetical protein [uncultured Shewanella sp.]